MKELRLTSRTQAMLRRIGKARFPLSVFGRSHGRVMPMIRHVVNRRLNLAGVTEPAANLYRRAVTELVKSFRTLTAEPLGRALLLAVRKWRDFGLDSNLLQALACDLFDRFEAAGRLPPKPKRLVPPPRQRRRVRRTYEQSLLCGRATRAKAGSIAEQAARHSAALARSREISRRLAALLKARGIPGRQFIAYNAFAQKLGRLSRHYSSRTLALAAADLVELYEARGLGRATLAAICAAIFDLPA